MFHSSSKIVLLAHDLLHVSHSSLELAEGVRLAGLQVDVAQARPEGVQTVLEAPRLVRRRAGKLNVSELGVAPQIDVKRDVDDSVRRVGFQLRLNCGREIAVLMEEVDQV